MFLPSNSTSKYMDGYEVHHRVTPVHNLWMFLVTRTQQNDHRGGFNPDSAIQMFLAQFIRPISQSLLTDAPSNFCPIEKAPEMFENAALFFRLGLPSTQIRQEHGTLFKPEEFENLVWTRNTLKTELL